MTADQTTSTVTRTWTGAVRLRNALEHRALEHLWWWANTVRNALPDYVPSSSCSIDRVDCAVGSVQRAPNRSEWAARRHVSGPNPVPVPVWSLEHEVRT